jgi:hypothetical protein
LVDRQNCHDNFALAVLIFKLVNEGTHPFDGVFRGHGEPPPLQARIAAGVFPYLDRSGNWTPKGLAPPFDALHPKLQGLFVQAFQAGHRTPELRPDASTWLEALRESEGDFQVCPHNSHHFHWGNNCHWCQRTLLLGGLDPFPKPTPQATNRTNHVAGVAQLTPAVQMAPAAPHPTPMSVLRRAMLLSESAFDLTNPYPSSNEMDKLLLDFGAIFSQARAEWRRDRLDACGAVAAAALALLACALFLISGLGWRVAMMIIKWCVIQFQSKTNP